ncbi:hypothetical protein BCD67_13805 [Oscillatoriales cyanobacterium USR001]|nr:hypothetical protein BCD67_13805 [Oscillatoriales cyanobacterium USR001]
MGTLFKFATMAMFGLAVQLSTVGVSIAATQLNSSLSNGLEQVDAEHSALLILAKYEPDPNGNPKSDGTGTRYPSGNPKS